MTAPILDGEGDGQNDFSDQEQSLISRVMVARSNHLRSTSLCENMLYGRSVRSTYSVLYPYSRLEFPVSRDVNMPRLILCVRFIHDTTSRCRVRSAVDVELVT